MHNLVCKYRHITSRRQWIFDFPSKSKYIILDVKPQYKNNIHRNISIGSTQFSPLAMSVYVNKEICKKKNISLLSVKLKMLCSKVMHAVKYNVYECVQFSYI